MNQGNDFGIGGPTSAAWREEALARVEGLRFLQTWMANDPECGGLRGCRDSIDRHLNAAREAADRPEARATLRPHKRRATPRFERALVNLDTAETDLLRLAPGTVLEGALPSIQAHVNRFLAKDDPRRMALEKLYEEAVATTGDGQRERGRCHSAEMRPQDLPGRGEPGRLLEAPQREMVLNALFAANTQRQRNLARVRSFRNMLYGGIAAASVIALALAVIGRLAPSAIPLCFVPDANGQASLVCPQTTSDLGATFLDADTDMDDRVAQAVKPGDLALVELLGLVGAALSVGGLMRTMKGTSTPYNVPLLLAVLKIPIGAVTAVVGLILMRGEFIPGLSALDNQAQILGWAVIFGISQHLVTRLADDRADAILEEVGGRGAAGDRPLPTHPWS